MVQDLAEFKDRRSSYTLVSNQLLPLILMALISSDPDAVIRNVYEGVAYFSTQPKKYCYAVWADNDLLYDAWTDSPAWYRVALEENKQ